MAHSMTCPDYRTSALFQEWNGKVFRPPFLHARSVLIGGKSHTLSTIHAIFLTKTMSNACQPLRIRPIPNHSQSTLHLARGQEDTLVHVWGLPPFVPDLTSITPSADIDPTTWPRSSRLVEPFKCWLDQARISFMVKDSVTKVGNGGTSVSGLYEQSRTCVCRDRGNPEGVIRWSHNVFP